MAGMERFTQRARRVLSLAHQEAERSQHSTIGTEHLLVGLLEEEEGVASRVLHDLGISSERVREAIGQIAPGSSNFDPDRVELSEETQRTLELAVDEARRLGHHYIGTEHILLGLMRFDSPALRVLQRLGVTVEQVRTQMRRVLNETTSSRHISAEENSKKLNQVFILHGHEEWKKTIAALVQSLGLVPVLLDTRNEGKTGIEYLDKRSGDVVLAAIILTDNDPSILPSDPNQANLRIDRHVVFELGYFRGKLGQRHVCILYLEDFQQEVSLLSGLAGVTSIPLDAAGSWMMQFARVIQDAELK